MTTETIIIICSFFACIACYALGHRHGTAELNERLRQQWRECSTFFRRVYEERFKEGWQPRRK